MTELARPLEIGWLPDTPIGDSLLRRFLRLGFLPFTRFTLWAVVT